MTKSDDEYVDDDDLMIEAARVAHRQGVNRNKFMTLAKRAWFEAEAEQRGAQRERERILGKSTT